MKHSSPKARHNNLLLNGVGSWVGLRGQALYSYFWFEENGPKIFLEATEKGDKDFTEKAVVFLYLFPVWKMVLHGHPPHGKQKASQRIYCKPLKSQKLFQVFPPKNERDILVAN